MENKTIQNQKTNMQKLDLLYENLMKLDTSNGKEVENFISCLENEGVKVFSCEENTLLVLFKNSKNPNLSNKKYDKKFYGFIVPKRYKGDRSSLIYEKTREALTENTSSAYEGVHCYVYVKTVRNDKDLDKYMSVFNGLSDYIKTINIRNKRSSFTLSDWTVSQPVSNLLFSKNCEIIFNNCKFRPYFEESLL